MIKLKSILFEIGDASAKKYVWSRHQIGDNADNTEFIEVLNRFPEELQRELLDKKEDMVAKNNINTKYDFTGIKDK